jgi:outer membrane protein assembly factor BamD (BamD/ComL family)
VSPRKSTARLARFALAAAFIACALLFGCATGVPAPRPDLTPTEFFQNAQEAANEENFNLAIQYYRLFQTQYPDDIDHQAWAAYEIAFLYHKKGDDKTAVALFDELLARYAKGENLPEGPKVLAEKVKANILAKSAPAETTAAPSPPPGPK